MPYEYGVAKACCRATFPEDFTHELVGQLVRFTNGDRGGVVERVFPTRYGLLATFKGGKEARRTAYPITDLTPQEGTK